MLKSVVLTLGVLVFTRPAQSFLLPAKTAFGAFTRLRISKNERSHRCLGFAARAGLPTTPNVRRGLQGALARHVFDDLPDNDADRDAAQAVRNCETCRVDPRSNQDDHRARALTSCLCAGATTVGSVLPNTGESAYLALGSTQNSIGSNHSESFDLVQI